MRRFGIVTVVAALLLPAAAHRAQAVQRLIDVRQIATDTLRDVAVATFENGRPVIYYNPVLHAAARAASSTRFFLPTNTGTCASGTPAAALTAGDGDLRGPAPCARSSRPTATRPGLGEPSGDRRSLRFFTRMASVDAGTRAAQARQDSVGQQRLVSPRGTPSRFRPAITTPLNPRP